MSPDFLTKLTSIFVKNKISWLNGKESWIPYSLRVGNMSFSRFFFPFFFFSLFFFCSFCCGYALDLNLKASILKRVAWALGAVGTHAMMVGYSMGTSPVPSLFTHIVWQAWSLSSSAQILTIKVEILSDFVWFQLFISFYHPSTSHKSPLRLGFFVSPIPQECVISPGIQELWQRKKKRTVWDACRPSSVLFKILQFKILLSV